MFPYGVETRREVAPFLSDEGVAVRAAAVEAMAMLGHKAARPHLDTFERRATMDASPLVRATAVNALGLLGEVARWQSAAAVAGLQVIGPLLGF